MGKVLGLGLVAVVAIVGFIVWQSGDKSSMESADTMTPKVTEMAKTQAPVAGTVKEFTTTAYYDETGVWYSLKEMRVKKGDTVRVKATNTKGMHDLTIDEYGVKTELPLNQEVVIEFVADKVGEFTYYCSKPGHRAKGQFGKLVVE